MKFSDTEWTRKLKFEIFLDNGEILSLKYCKFNFSCLFYILSTLSHKKLLMCSRKRVDQRMEPTGTPSPIVQSCHQTSHPELYEGEYYSEKNRYWSDIP